MCPQRPDLDLCSLLLTQSPEPQVQRRSWKRSGTLRQPPIHHSVLICDDPDNPKSQKEDVRASRALGSHCRPSILGLLLYLRIPNLASLKVLESFAFGARSLQALPSL